MNLLACCCTCRYNLFGWCCTSRCTCNIRSKIVKLFNTFDYHAGPYPKEDPKNPKSETDDSTAAQHKSTTADIENPKYDLIESTGEQIPNTKQDENNDIKKDGHHITLHYKPYIWFGKTRESRKSALGEFMKYIALFVVCCPLVWCLLSFFINLWEDIIWRFSYPSVLWVVYGIALISIFLDFIVNVCILYILGNTVVLNNVTGDFFCIGIIISFFLVPIIYQSSIHPDDEFNTTYTQVSINILDSFSIIAVTVGNIVLNKLTESSILSSITQYTIYFKDIFGVEPNNDRNSVNLAKESVRHSLQRKSGGHSQEHKPEQEDARKGEEDNEEKGVSTIQVHIDNNVHDNAEKSLGKHFRKRNLGTNEQEEKEDKENEEQKKKSVQDFKDLEKAHHHNTNRNDEVLKHTLKQVGKFATGLLKDDGLTIQGVKIEKRFFVLMENIIERGLDEFDFRNENSASAQFRFALRVKLTINLLSTLLFIFYSSIYLSAPNGCYSFVLFLTMLNFLNNFTSATCIKVHDDTVIKVYSNDEFDLNLSMGKFQGFNHLQFYGTTALTLFNLIFRISITSKPTP